MGNLLYLGASILIIFGLNYSYIKVSKDKEALKNNLIQEEIIKDSLTKKIKTLEDSIKKLNVNKYYLSSYYGKAFHGKLTAFGERFNMYSLTAAHKTLPPNTKLLVTNTLNNKSVVVKVNDRGPYVKGREIDLSQGAFEKISSLNTGVIKVKIQII